MSTRTLEADYVIVGSGTSGMAFADILVTESDATMIMLDRRASPGGHWVDSYPFVRLHQPSSFYGVNSRPLGSDRIDSTGWNAGMYELASGPEVRSYFDLVMREQFIPSGRVTYLPMTEFLGDGTARSLLSGAEVSVKARKKVVNAHYLGSEIPSTHTPSFTTESGITLIPVNDLVKVRQRYERHVLIGGGKTSADAAVWLLENGVDPASIVWIRAKDMWFFDRAHAQPGPAFFEQTIGGFASVLKAASEADSIDDLFARIEQAGVFTRIDPDVWPTVFRGATMSAGELELLRKIENVVRLGHVKRIGTDRIQLTDGEIESSPEWLFVDCSAEGIRAAAPIPTFSGDVITPQIFQFPPIASYMAAIVAVIELELDDDGEKNAMCEPVTFARGGLHEFAGIVLQGLRNQERWQKCPRLQDWTATSRLNAISKAMTTVAPDESGKLEIMTQILEATPPAMANLERLLAS